MTLLSISIIIKKRGSDEVNNIWTRLKLLLLSLIKSPYPVDIISNISDIPLLSISTIIKESGSKEVNKTWTQLELLLLSLIKSSCQVDTISNISDIIKKPGTEEENNMWTQLKKELSNPILHTDCIVDVEIETIGDKVETDEENGEIETIGDNIETDEENGEIETNGDNLEIETDEDNEEIETHLIRREKWYGPGGMRELILERTGCKVYTGCGINYRKAKQTTILKAKDGTLYYDDDLKNPNKPKYTLYGPEGDQDRNEKSCNEPLLNENKTKHIYLYRQTEKEYIWYGKYKIIGEESKLHIGDDGLMRNIIILILKRCL